MADPTHNAVQAAGKRINYATSFADPADVAAFKRCKEHGNSDKVCFRVGDNGIGYWGDRTSEGSGSACALPPEDLRAKWGTLANAHNKEVVVTANGKKVVCRVRDTMPHKDHIKNGAIIDLNPDACFHLGLKPPAKVPAEWQWV